MYLFSFFILYFLLIFVVRSLILWKQTGINPLTFNKGDDAHGFNGKVFTLISVVELVVVSIYAFLPDWYDYLLPFWYLEHPTAVKVGWIFLILSLIFVLIAQSHMAQSWRIGIDEKNKSTLVTTGLFSISRNPVFLGIMVANVGLFLVLPNAFTLLITALSSISMNTQIRLEETFLEEEFGEDYQRYKAKVRRWL